MTKAKPYCNVFLLTLNRETMQKALEIVRSICEMHGYTIEHIIESRVVQGFVYIKISHPDACEHVEEALKKFGDELWTKVERIEFR